jgi:hypothetical protein
MWRRLSSVGSRNDMPPIVKMCELYGESLVEGLAHVVYGLCAHDDEYSHA